MTLTTDQSNSTGKESSTEKELGNQIDVVSTSQNSNQVKIGPIEKFKTLFE